MEGERILGLATRSILEDAVARQLGDQALSTLLRGVHFPHMHPDQPLPLVLERMTAAHVDLLPVVSRADIHILEGIVTLHDVLQTYGVDDKPS
jgi:CIC family chloride channel protein